MVIFHCYVNVHQRVPYGFLHGWFFSPFFPGLGIESSRMWGTGRCGKSYRCSWRRCAAGCFFFFFRFDGVVWWFMDIYGNFWWCCLMIYGYLWQFLMVLFDDLWQFMMVWWWFMAIYDGLMMIYDCWWWFFAYEHFTHTNADLDNLDLCFLLLNSFGSLILLELCFSPAGREWARPSALGVVQCWHTEIHQ